ncbi:MULTISPECIES: SipW-dependent-type signal peptide-containing protein [Salinibaculum]|uniref:SipW-dependent-type signal peptide-containing protein n=1 Tax=Salinibaculum TaxID=2732368 RepID=UPI0030D584D1
MSDQYDISRRKVLAGLGTIGVAGAGAGLGTSAYFSDQETFTNNELVAGELDLKVGWEEHYSDWSDDENDNLAGNVTMVEGDVENMTAGSVSGTRVGLPSNVAAMISVEDDADAMQFLDNTQEDSYPSGYDASTVSGNFTCSNPTNDDGQAVLADDDGEGATPVIDLNDVKPGDFGEVTFSFALCDNPGYVWAQAFLQSASENGLTEPEADDPDEDGDADSTDPADVELLDAIKVAVWLDDGDNYQNGGEQPLVAGSLRSVINGSAPGIDGTGIRLDGRTRDFGGNIGSDGPAPDAELTDFTTPDVTRFDTDGSGTVENDVELVDDPDGSGKVAHATSGGVQTTDYVTSGVRVGATMGDFGSGASLTYEYYEGEENAQAAPDEVYLLLRESDGTEHVVYRTSNDDRPNGNLNSPSRPSGNWYTRNVGDEIRGDFAYNDGFSWNDLSTGDNYSALNTNFAGDTEIVSMAFGKGNIGNGTVSDVYYKNPSLDENSLGNFPTSCFRGDGTVYNGVFAWWLPVDHANEIQSDTATFELGLYTEQCRHNDGTGNPPTQSE